MSKPTKAEIDAAAERLVNDDYSSFCLPSEQRMGDYITLARAYLAGRASEDEQLAAASERNELSPTLNIRAEFIPDDDGGYIRYNGKDWRPIR